MPILSKKNQLLITFCWRNDLRLANGSKEHDYRDFDNKKLDTQGQEPGKRPSNTTIAKSWVPTQPKSAKYRTCPKGLMRRSAFLLGCAGVVAPP